MAYTGVTSMFMDPHASQQLHVSNMQSDDLNSHFLIQAAEKIF